MLRKPLIAANWKMHKTIQDTLEFVNQMKEVEIHDDKEVLIFPPFTALNEACTLLSESPIEIGGQNMHYAENGAFTGEISPLMLKEAGCTHVLIGHSERRHIFKEDDELINKKILSALKHELIPVLCVGETAHERQDGLTKEIIKNQITTALQGIEDVQRIIIAYEPVWAIGTGVNATPEQAEEVHAYIRAIIEGRYNKDAAECLKILYGGSVNLGNIKRIMIKDDIDGVLVGGASLEPLEFYKLINFDKD